MMTPSGWDENHQIHLGSTFNFAHSLSQMLHLRPHNRFEDLDSVYLVGGGTHPGSGLPVIFESARITSRLIGEELGTTVPVDGDDRSQSDRNGMDVDNESPESFQPLTPYNDWAAAASGSSGGPANVAR